MHSALARQARKRVYDTSGRFRPLHATAEAAIAAVVRLLPIIQTTEHPRTIIRRQIIIKQNKGLPVLLTSFSRSPINGN
jgi:hypothetical protein